MSLLLVIFGLSIGFFDVQLKTNDVAEYTEIKLDKHTSFKSHAFLKRLWESKVQQKYGQAAKHMADPVRFGDLVVYDSSRGVVLFSLTKKRVVGYYKKHRIVATNENSQEILIAGRNVLKLINMVDRKTKWRVKNPLPDVKKGEFTSNLIILGTPSGRVLAVDQDDGEMKWEVSVNESIVSHLRKTQRDKPADLSGDRPIFLMSDVIVGQGFVAVRVKYEEYHFVISYDIANGKALWVRELDAYSSNANVTDGKRIYFVIPSSEPNPEYPHQTEDWLYSLMYYVRQFKCNAKSPEDTNWNIECYLEKKLYSFCIKRLDLPRKLYFLNIYVLDGMNGELLKVFKYFKNIRFTNIHSRGILALISHQSKDYGAKIYGKIAGILFSISEDLKIEWHVHYRYPPCQHDNSHCLSVSGKYIWVTPQGAHESYEFNGHRLDDVEQTLIEFSRERVYKEGIDRFGQFSKRWKAYIELPLLEWKNKFVLVDERHIVLYKLVEGYAEININGKN